MVDPQPCLCEVGYSNHLRLFFERSALFGPMYNSSICSPIRTAAAAKYPFPNRSMERTTSLDAFSTADAACSLGVVRRFPPFSDPVCLPRSLALECCTTELHKGHLTRATRASQRADFDRMDEHAHIGATSVIFEDSTQ